MNLTRLSQISEIVTGIAIVITLIILILEVSGNTRAMEYQLELERYDRLFGMVGESEYLPAILEKIKEVDDDGSQTVVSIYMEHYSLTYEEAERWARYMGVMWSALQAEFNYGIDNSGYIRRLLTNPDQYLYWDAMRNSGWYDPDFVAYVEDVRD